MIDPLVPADFCRTSLVQSKENTSVAADAGTSQRSAGLDKEGGIHWRVGVGKLDRASARLGQTVTGKPWRLADKN